MKRCLTEASFLWGNEAFKIALERIVSLQRKGLMAPNYSALWWEVFSIHPSISSVLYRVTGGNWCLSAAVIGLELGCSLERLSVHLRTYVNACTHSEQLKVQWMKQSCSCTVVTYWVPEGSCKLHTERTQAWMWQLTVLLLCSHCSITYIWI